MSNNSYLHFIVSFFIMIVIYTIFRFQVGRSFLPMGLALLGTLFLGLCKELYDNVFNPWRLSPNALLNDTYQDLWMNIIGIVLAFFIIITVEEINKTRSR